ncbi:MAG: aspartate--ammonia ligase, partial [Acholeplasmataceae bacterium]
KRVSAPLFVLSKSGINDGLSGETPVKFMVNDLNEEAEIVHSLAKWKRMALYNYDFHIGNGLYTDMNAIRKEEVLDNLHSIYVDQWDWEKVISKEDRNLNYLKEVVNKIANAIYLTSVAINKKYKKIDYIAPNDVFFIDSEELLRLYPNLSSEEREYEISKKHGVVFIIKIGYPLSNGNPHSLRAPDYDDWELNGDLIYYHKTLDTNIELSSMGIRVDNLSLIKQLTYLNRLDDLKYEYHSLINDNKLPYTIGGGIGQSRLCMLLLEKAHIGEVQSSVWDNETILTTKGKINLI